MSRVLSTNGRVNFATTSVAVGLFVFACVLGCDANGPTTYSVEGKVIFRDRSPVELGVIEFRLVNDSEQRITARGKIEADGSFRLSTFSTNDGALPGVHQVVVQQLVISEGIILKDHKHGRRVPKKYADYATTDLTATVEPIESNHLEVVLDLR